MSRKFFTGPLMTRLPVLDAKIRTAMAASAMYTSGQAEVYMKSEAVWTDRTGAARNGLGSETDIGADRVAVILYHSVAYGPYLELRWGGKYAIIEPTMAAMGPVFLEAMKRLTFN